MSGTLCRTFAPEASGHGTDAVIDAYHNLGGRIRARVPFVKAVATAISLGTGGSGGREGPIAQIGAGFGSLLGQLLNLTRRQRRILLAAGMGAGVGAIFRAPLAGALFAAEILYREAEFEADVLIPTVLSSTVAYCVYCGWFVHTGDLAEFGHLFKLEGDFEFRSLHELLPYRPRNAHKGTCGRVLLVAGSQGYTGAAALAALACLRGGAGLVYVGIPSSLNDIMEMKLTEAITIPILTASP